MNQIAGIDPSIRGTAITMISEDKTEIKSYFFSGVKKYSDFNSDIIKPIFLKQKNDDENVGIIYYNRLTDCVCSILKEYEPLKVLLEGYSYRSKGMLYSIGEMVGLLKYKILLLNMHDLDVIAPTEIKKYIDKGNSDKDKLWQSFSKQYSLKFGVSDKYIKELNRFISEFGLIKAGSKIGSPLSDILDSLYISLFYFARG